MNPFLQEAIDLSIKNVLTGGGPFGAVIVKDGKIIGRGVNMVTKNQDPTAHAEIVAIREACMYSKNFSLEGSIIYSSTEPCSMCYSAIRWAKIKDIFYSNSRQDASKIGFDDLEIYTEIENKITKGTRMISNNALDAFTAWEKSNSKRY